jgi:hypothetical protein
MEAAKAVLAGVTETASTLWAASVQCGIVAGARSLGSPVQAQCMVMCCWKQTGSGIPTGAAFAVGGTPVAAVAAGHVVLLDMCVPALDCMASAVAPELVCESDTVHAAVAR